MTRLNVCWCLFVAFHLAGCGSSERPSAVTCPNPEQSTTWLLSEVNDEFENHPKGSFRFPFLNQTGKPVTLRVRSIGCSCYQVKRGDTRFKVDDRFEIGIDQSEILALVPPRPRFDGVSDYNFTLEYEQKPGEPKSIITCQGELHCIADVRINPTLLLAEFVHDSPPQTVVMEVTRTARRREAAEQKISTHGWPEGVQVEEPTPVGNAVEILDGLWKQTWKVKARISTPRPSATPQEMWSIRVGGAEPDSPENNVQLMVRYRSGLSGPRIVHFGDVRVGQPITRRIQILARDDQPFRILGPSDPSELLSLRSDSPGATKAHWGNLTMNAQSPGDFRQIMQVVTDHPQQQNLTIEIRANITSPVAATEESQSFDKP